MNLFERVAHLLEYSDAGRRAMFAKLKHAGGGSLLQSAPVKQMARMIHGQHSSWRQPVVQGKFKPGQGHKELANVHQLSRGQRAQLRTSILHKKMHRSATNGLADVSTDHSHAMQKKAGLTTQHSQDQIRDVAYKGMAYGHSKANAQKAHLRLKMALGKDAEHKSAQASALRAVQTRNKTRHAKVRAAIRAKKG